MLSDRKTTNCWCPKWCLLLFLTKKKTQHINSVLEIDISSYYLAICLIVLKVPRFCQEQTEFNFQTRYSGLTVND